jgi:hypothetical protein
MARNLDLKDIQGGRSRVQQTRFECPQSCRAGVRIYCRFRSHRLRWCAGYRAPAARLGRHPSVHRFLGAMSIEKGMIRSARKT